MKLKQRKYINPNLTIPYNLDKQFPAIGLTHLHQNKTPNTDTKFRPNTMNKIYIIRVNYKHQPHTWTSSNPRNTHCIKYRLWLSLQQLEI
jgi:hypothetical protein